MRDGLVLVEIPAIIRISSWVNSRLEFYSGGEKVWQQNLDPMPYSVFIELQDHLYKPLMS